MPTIVVSDTNVFIALFRGNLLSKIFASVRVTVLIPEEIYRELTQNYRVTTEYPGLATLVTSLRHNPQHGLGVTLQVSEIETSLVNTLALETYLELKEDASLDRGEIEAIPLAIEHSALFLSCDADALDEFNALVQSNGSSAQHLMDYCQVLVAQGVITKKDFQDIEAIITS